MKTDTTPPRGFEDWLASLRHNDIGKSFQTDTAALLRVIAGTKNGAVCLASGREAVPYVHWLQDGMTMNSRLIVHNQSQAINELAQPHLSTDIRVATHAQDFASFLSDIEEHRFDLMVIDAGGLSHDVVPAVLQRLAEYGLLLGVGLNVSCSQLIEACTKAYFLFHLNDQDRSVFISKKSMQHRAVRRGGRRRHAAVGQT